MLIFPITILHPRAFKTQFMTTLELLFEIGSSLSQPALLSGRMDKT